MSEFIKLCDVYGGDQYINFELVETFEPAPEKDPEWHWEARTEDNPNGVVGAWIYLKSSTCEALKVRNTPKEILAMLK